jgi:hypothetical protein
LSKKILGSGSAGLGLANSEPTGGIHAGKRTSSYPNPTYLRRGEGQRILYYHPGVEETNWAGKMMELTDPFGNKL